MPDNPVSLIPRHPPPRWRIPINLDLAILLGILIFFNLPYLSGDFLPEHDTKENIFLFHQFYAHAFWRGSLPVWLPADYGNPALPWQLLFISPSQCFAGFIGLLLRLTDTLLLYKVACAIDQCILLLGTYLVAKRLYSERATVFIVTLGIACTSVWYREVGMCLRLVSGLPLIIYFTLRFVDERRLVHAWLAGIVLLLNTIGGAAYFASILGVLCLTIALVLVLPPRRLPFGSLKPWPSALSVSY